MRLDLGLAVVLAATAGALNSAGFFAYGMFAANMTGNASSMSELVALGQIGAAFPFLVVLAAFVVGAFGAGVAIELQQRRGARFPYASVLGVEGAALIALGLVDLAHPALAGPLATVTALAFLMGGQNALTTRISGGRVRTTHVSGMATDVGLAAAARLVAADSGASTRLALFGSTIGAFVCGGVLGVLIYGAFGGALFCALGAILVTIAAVSIAR